MTDNEKLRKLFQAALRVPDQLQPGDQAAGTAASGGIPQPASQVLPPPVPISSGLVAAAPSPAPGIANAGLDAAASAELGALLDEQHKRKRRKRRLEALATLGVFLALTGGGFGWFVHSPERVQAFHEAMRDIHSLGDIQGLVAKYRIALDRVAVHSGQIDGATESMGVSSHQDGEKDPNFDKEMHTMMGGGGTTSGERSRGLLEKFGNRKPDVAAPSAAAETRLGAGRAGGTP
ncbi:MAG: hypothetical protein WCK77_09940 [Verrucomicrobiota bacterium]